MDLGADAARVDKDGQNVLHVAASVGHWKSILALISAGAKINQQDNMGNTPAHKAAQYISNGSGERKDNGKVGGDRGLGRNHLWNMLIRGGANLSIKNNLSQTPTEAIFTQESKAKKRKSAPFPASKVENAKRKRSRILKNRRKST